MKKGFLIDESVNKRLSDALESKGFSLHYVRDCCPAAPDEDVLAYAHAHGLVLITFDRGFGDVAGIHSDMPGIVVIDRSVRRPRPMPAVSNSYCRSSRDTSLS